MESTERSYAVYIHTSPSGKRYVGITRQTVNARWRGGGIGYKGCPYFWRAIVKYGWDNITHQIIAEGLTGEEAKRLEKELIAFHKTRDPSCGYNLTDGGDGVCGWAPSAETRAKISAANMGNKYCLGRQVSDATRSKISAANKGNQNLLGYKHTIEALAANSAAHMGNQNRLGRKHTDATRAAMRDAQKRRRAKESEGLIKEGVKYHGSKRCDFVY